jgi:hypothetical protein
MPNFELWHSWRKLAIYVFSWTQKCVFIPVLWIKKHCCVQLNTYVFVIVFYEIQNLTYFRRKIWSTPDLQGHPKNMSILCRSMEKFRWYSYVTEHEKIYQFLNTKSLLHVLATVHSDLQSVGSSRNVMPHGDARQGKWRGNWRMEWVTSTLHTTSEHGVSSITNADAHTSAVSSRLNWRPCRFKWTRPFRRKTKSGFCACAITF